MEGIRKYSKALLQKIPIFDVDPVLLNETISEHLKSEKDLLILPKNVDLIKTGFAKEMPPTDPDWYYKRAAGVFRRIVVLSMNEDEGSQGIGTHYFARKYSTRKNRGVRPSNMVKGATGHIKTILLDLARIGWIKKVDVGYKADVEGFKAMCEFVEKIK